MYDFLGKHFCLFCIIFYEYLPICLVTVNLPFVQMNICLLRQKQFRIVKKTHRKLDPSVARSTFFYESFNFELLEIVCKGNDVFYNNTIPNR